MKYFKFLHAVNSILFRILSFVYTRSLMKMNRMVLKMALKTAELQYKRYSKIPLVGLSASLGQRPLQQSHDSRSRCQRELLIQEYTSYDILKTEKKSDSLSL